MSLIKYIFAFTVLLFLPCKALYADEFAPAVEESTPKIHKDVYHLYDDVSLTREVKVKYYKPNIMLRATYPEMASEQYADTAKAFNLLVTNLIDNEADDFKKRVQDAQEARTAMGAKVKKNASDKLFIDYSASVVMSGEHPIISLRFNAQGFVIGEAHPRHEFIVLNFDADAMRTISLSELFLPDSNFLHALSQYTRAVLSKKLATQSMVSEGTAPQLQNFEIWNIKPDGIMFTFNEGTVAPYVYGAQYVVVPYTVLQALIDPQSIIAGCVAHQKQCVKNNLMTGGFSDMA